MELIMIAQCISPMIIVLLLSYHSRVTSSQTISFSQPATGPSSVCEGSNVTLQCRIIFINSNNVTIERDSIWTRNGTIVTTAIPNHRLLRNSTTGAFTDLLITNVTLADDNTVYTCTDTGAAITSSVVLNVTGQPGDINDLIISSDTITACSFVVQWSRPSSDPYSYTVIISTEGGSLIITDNTTLTNYSVTGLNSNTVYNVSVTANNVCGSSNAATVNIITKRNGLPSNPTNIAVSSLIDGSIAVNWTITDPSYSYTVIWTSLSNSVMNSFTVSQNTNYYIITGLSDNVNYAVNIATVDVCGMIITSDPITICDFLTTKFRPVSEICVTSFNISWDVSNDITCGDVSYEVSIFPPPIEGDAVTTTYNMFYNVTGLNNSLPNVTITVTARNRAGQGDNRTVFVELPKPLDPPPVYNITTSSSTTPADLTGFDIIISWSRPAIDSCTTLPITGYYIHAIVTNTNGDVNERVYTSNYIDDMLGGIKGEFSVSYNDSFEQDLHPNANYIFVVNTQNDVSEISGTNSRPSCTDDESDDELSTGAAVAITFVVTFIITLVVTALITYIITSLYYKHWHELKEKITVDDDNTKQKNPYGANIIMDTNPAYATTATIKMDTNPAYAINT